MLLHYGKTKVSRNWQVVEEEACGFVRLYFIQGGEQVYESETETKQLEIGKLYLFPDRIPYRISQNVENRLECFWMHFDITPFVLSRLLEIDLEEHIILKQLIEAFSTISVEWKTDIGGSIQQYLTFAIIEYLKMKRMLERVDEKIEKGTMYIQKHLGEEVTLEEISDYCGYHSKYFIRLFKASMGVTPHQFLVNCRMKKALSMLLAGTSVKEVAATVGYKESKNFSRAFRQKYGMTPSQVNTLMKESDRI